MIALDPAALIRQDIQRGVYRSGAAIVEHGAASSCDH
jgi:hypothetical protein